MRVFYRKSPHGDLWLRDVDLIQPLLEYPEDRERENLVRDSKSFKD